MTKRKFCFLLTAVLVLLALSPAAAAVETGSLKVVDILDPVGLYHVATPDAKLTAAFAGAPIEDISDADQAVSNARVLWSYARTEGIAGQERSPGADGSVSFGDLAEGLYLVGSLSQEAEFDPFFVQIPTTINGEKIYHVEAAPKQEAPTEPTDPTAHTDPTGPSDPSDPTDPTEPDDPEIPQTGNSVIPKYLLLALGTLATLAGLAELIRGKKETYE